MALDLQLTALIGHICFLRRHLRVNLTLYSLRFGFASGGYLRPVLFLVWTLLLHLNDRVLRNVLTNVIDGWDESYFIDGVGNWNWRSLVDIHKLIFLWFATLVSFLVMVNLMQFWLALLSDGNLLLLLNRGGYPFTLVEEFLRFLGYWYKVWCLADRRPFLFFSEGLSHFLLTNELNLLFVTFLFSLAKILQFLETVLDV